VLGETSAEVSEGVLEVVGVVVDVVITVGELAEELGVLGGGCSDQSSQCKIRSCHKKYLKKNYNYLYRFRYL